MYCDIIPFDLAVKLKEKGMPDIEIVWNPIRNKHYCFKTYAAVFDWLMEKEIYIRIIPFREVKGVNGTLWAWSWFMNRLTQPSISSDNFWMTWNEAADAAIEKALELI